ncbi:MAG: aminotransferase class IV family protein [Acidobacteriota bacterium]|nr:aminotransferase class IV family protein [Acidobacteriota bacterium]
MIHRFVFHNGRLAPFEEVRLSPGQAGLLNGWGLFTTLRVVEGVAFAFERHWKRLSRDAMITRCPFPFEAEKVQEQLAEVLRANDVREGSARIYVVHNKAGFWRSDDEMPDADLLMYSADLPPVRHAVRLAIREHGRHAASPLAGVKVTSWLNNVWTLAEAQHAGWDEVILLNERGEVSECTAANIFCVQEGRVLTPPLASGCLEGVTRSLVLELGPAAGIEVEEQTLFPEDLYCSEEVFISSTNRNVIGVAEIGGHRTKTPLGPVTRRIDEAFTAYVRDYVDAHAAVPGER